MKVVWTEVRARLEANPEKLWSLNEMERTGGEPDVVGQDKKRGEYIFYPIFRSWSRARNRTRNRTTAIKAFHLTQTSWIRTLLVQD